LRRVDGGQRTKDVKPYGRVRYAVRIEGLRRRPRQPKVWDRPLTVAKMKFTAPAGYLRAESLPRQKLVRFTPAIDRILFDDKSPPVLKRGPCHREDGESSSGRGVQCVYSHPTVGAVAVSGYRRQPMECIIFGGS
jgi:hypothetical protein